MPRFRILIVSAAALVVAQVALPAHAAREVSVYEGQHRSAGDLLPGVVAAFGKQGLTAVVDGAGNRIVLAGEAAVVADAVALLAQEDRAPRIVLIRQESRRSSDLERSGIEVRWSAELGSVRIGNVSRLPPGTQVAVSGGRERERTSRTTTSTVRVLEGEVAAIGTGTSVPVTVRVGPYRSTAYVSAGSGVRVRPTILGDGRIELSIDSSDGELGPGGLVRQASESTKVVVSPGESVALGSLQRSSSSRRRGDRGVHDVSDDQDIVILVTAEVDAERESAPVMRPAEVR